VAGKARKQLLQRRRTPRPARQRKGVLLALAAAASSAASAINGWSHVPTSWQMGAATCGFVLTACLCLAGQEADHSKKNLCHLA
jgi:peptidoglycan/LPS O-acetylase OafA/YrhL